MESPAASIFCETARYETTLPNLPGKCSVYSSGTRLEARLSWSTSPRTNPQEILRSPRFGGSYGRCVAVPRHTILEMAEQIVVHDFSAILCHFCARAQAPKLKAAGQPIFEGGQFAFEKRQRICGLNFRVPLVLVVVVNYLAQFLYRAIRRQIAHTNYKSGFEGCSRLRKKGSPFFIYCP